MGKKKMKNKIIEGMVFVMVPLKIVSIVMVTINNNNINFSSEKF